MKSKFLFLIFLLPCALLFMQPGKGIQAQAAVTATPEPPGKGEMKFFAFFTPPPTVNPPTQADSGAQTYFYICMVCHGDVGQGLAAWRQKLEPPDNNCFQSKCHAPNHMDFGFTFPHDVPPLHNRGMLLTFQNAYALYNFVRAKMPWQHPNSLSEAQALELTAFLMRMNGVALGSTPLTVEGARSISLLSKTPTPTFAAPPAVDAGLDPVLLGTGAILLVAAAVMGAYVVRARRGG